MLLFLKLLQRFGQIRNAVLVGRVDQIAKARRFHLRLENEERGGHRWTATHP